MLEIFQKIINTLTKNKITILLVVLFCGIFGLLAGIDPVFAQEKPSTVMIGIVTVLGWIAFFLSYVVGYIATVIIDVLIWVVQFNNIINVEAVKVGWVIVRDLANMFFVLVLLVIAFATILRIESYNAKKLLPKLLIMAVVINFSKTIFGIIIDFSQVIMLTFVNGFAETGTGHFVAMFQMDKYFSMVNVSKMAHESGSGLAVAAGILMGLMAMTISAIVILVLLATLIIRIILLWVYTILSPFVFLGFAFPAMQKYTGKIWEDFIKQVVVGPILAFFIWLALLTAGTSSVDLGEKKGTGPDITTGGTQIQVTSPNALFSTGNFQSYIITIALLIGGLMVTQSMGGAAGSIAGKGMDWAKKVGAAPVAGLGKLSKNIGGWAVDKASMRAGVNLNVVEGYERMKKQMEDNKKDRKIAIRGKVEQTAEDGGRFRGTLAHMSTGDVFYKNLSNWRKGGMKSFGTRLWRGKRENTENDLEKLQEERKGVITVGKKMEYRKDIINKKGSVSEIDKNIEEQRLAVRTAPEDQKKSERSKLEGLLNERKLKSNELSATEKELEAKTVDNKEAERIDNQIKAKEAILKSYNIEGMTQSRGETKSTMDAEQGKSVSQTDNSDELGQILEEAIKNGQQGLVNVITKKMTKNGDYNEIMKRFGFGTGLNGMHGFADKLQKEGGFSEQAALGLLGEMGNIAKQIQHFGAFGTVKMDKNGRWEKTDETEYETAKYFEMSKVQKQKFARDTNRLGLGHYEGGKHDDEHFVLDKSAIALLKDPAFVKQYDAKQGTANPQVVSYLAHHVDDLERNGAHDLAVQIKIASANKKADPELAVKSVNLNR